MGGGTTRSRLCRIAFASVLLLGGGVTSCGGDDGEGTADGAEAQTADVSDVRTADVSGGADVPAAGVADALPADGAAADGAADDAAARPWWTQLAPGDRRVREILGVASHMDQGVGDDPLRNFELDVYEAMGGVAFREHFRWNHVEPEDGVFEWDGYDVQVALAKEHGVEVLPMVGYDVAWARQVPGDDASIRPEDFEDYAWHVADRYCDDIHTYEIWNEPNLDVFWEPEPDAAAYGELLKAARRGIRRACPDARVGTGGIAFWDLQHWDADWGYVRELAAAHPDICDAFDVMMVHPYTWGMQRSPEYDGHVGTLETPGYVEMIARLRDRLGEMGCRDRPIVFTEAGWPSLNIGEELQARWLARGVLLSAMLGVERYYWYTFWDSEPDPESFPPQDDWFGLYAWPGADESVRRAKPAAVAFRALADVMGDGRYAGSLREALALPEDVWVLVFLADDGDLLVAAWDGRDDPDGATAPPTDGGAVTSYDVALVLPPDTTAVAAHDIFGAVTDAPTDGDVLPLHLTPRPLYVHIQRGPAH